jgi:hypothetical protein
VVVLEDGLVHFYDDIYGHDVALQQALAKDTRILVKKNEGKLPAAYRSHVHVDEVGIAIVAHTPALQAQSGIPHRGGGNSR